MDSKTSKASFLSMPEKWDDQKDRWKELTVEGKLLQELCELVRGGATTTTFDNLRADLLAWRASVKDLPFGESQWGIARQLLELARLATPGQSGALLDQAAYAGLETWKWDAFCMLRNTPRQVEDKVTLNAPLVYQTRSFGIMVQLTLELIKDGKGDIYPAPDRHAFLEIDPDFEKAINDAILYVTQTKKLSLNGVDVRFRLERHDQKTLPSSLSGPSIGGAFGIGLLKLVSTAGSIPVPVGEDTL